MTGTMCEDVGAVPQVTGLTMVSVGTDYISVTWNTVSFAGINALARAYARMCVLYLICVWTQVV